MLRKLFCLICIVAMGCFTVLTAAEREAVELPRFPSLSPDGDEIVFSWGGDLWRVGSDGGEAIRLTAHQFDDLYSSWSGDGQWLVFNSMRDGYLNLYRMRRDGSELSQLTYSDRFIRSPDYSEDSDGEPVITFSSYLEGDVYREQRPYSLSPQGGEHSRLLEAFGSEPRLSPNGERVVFTRGGYYHGWNRRHYQGPEARNIWVYDFASEQFSAITSRDGDDGRARWLDDETLIFMSDREDRTVNLYRIGLTENDSCDSQQANADEPCEPISAAQAERLTPFDERDVRYFDVAPDAEQAVLQVWDSLYTLDLADPEAEPVKLSLRAGEVGRDGHELRRIDRDVTEASLSPDGQVMAYIAYGRVYVRNLDEHSPTRRVSPPNHARHKDLAWSPDGLTLFFTSDADGSESIYTARVMLTRDEIEQAYQQPGYEPAPAAIDELPAARAPVTEEEADQQRPDEPDRQSRRDDQRPADAENDSGASGVDEDPFGPHEPPDPIDPQPDPDPADPDPMGPDPLDPQPDPVEPEPSEPVADPDTVPEDELTDEVAEDADVEGLLDPERWHEAVQFVVSPLIADEQSSDRQASPSPDGSYLAFRRGRGDLKIKDLSSGEIEKLVPGWDSSIEWRWSPDSRYIAYSQNDLNFAANIFVVPVDGSHEPVNITRHPRNDLNPRWSQDGRKLAFISNRSNETYDIYRVYLDRGLERYSPRDITRYYRDSRRAAGQLKPLPVDLDERAAKLEELEEQPAELDLENAWRRVERVTATPVNEYALEITPGGDRYTFNRSGEGLMLRSWDGSESKRLGGVASVQQLSLTGDRLVYVLGGRAGVVKLDNTQHERPDISDRLRIDLREQSLQKFHEAARVIEEGFYRPDMKGLDWQGLVADYESLIERARTPSEFSDIANQLMGELAASHMGVNNPGDYIQRREPSGRLGIEHERVELADGVSGYRVLSLVLEGPAAEEPMPLRPGDVITAVEQQRFAGDESLLQVLRGRVGKELLITFRRPDDGPNVERQALITPISFSELARLKYDDFKRRSRNKVAELSEGRLGYVHIQAMNHVSLERFQADLYAAAHGKEGLIIDVRNNGGGHTTDRILTSLMSPVHAFTLPAGADENETGHYPQDRLDAPRYTAPANMLANEKSYSNAEILAHAFRTLNRGTLVGEQTYGGVISTGSRTLIDGATVRRPFRGWYLPDGTDMEHNGAQPDIHIEQRPEDEVAGRDRQLEKAVEDLLERLDS
ncbi:S41 family peptidase [Halorhodospira halochloris]|uniref:S41 family peptidase n=1 Tax=Halorhodospira halochloris TaxID=1052 RepID=UPI001EE83D9C|nr:S41 family peptidase [Halorhodospira halochloris]MCG5530685.1 S41 family peptidase [Halorhodospira halochloris]